MSAWPQDTVVDALTGEWNALATLLSSLDDTQWLAPTALPGWTVHDIVAHLIGTESMLAGIAPPPVDLDVHSLPHVHNEIAAFNEQWVEGLRRTPHADLLERYRTITASQGQALRSMTAAEWDVETITPVGPAPYGRFMRIRTFDCWMHELDIRDAVDLPGPENGDSAETAFAEITGALAFVVGKQGKAPDGARITFQLSGPLARVLHLAVDGRASLVPELGGPATTTIGMDSRLFTRLSGGRVRAVDHRDAITLSGDTAVGERIVEHLAFTI